MNLVTILQPFARLFFVGGSLTVVASILANFGHLSWHFDLLSHFKVQYFFLLLVVSTFFILYRRLLTALLFITVCLANLIPVLSLYLKPPSPEGGHGGTIRIMLVNVNTRQGNPEKVLQIVSNLNPDILVLQEISDQWVEQLAKLRDHYPESIIEPREDNFGIGLFSKFHLQSPDVLTIGSADIPSITAQVDTPFGKISILATHPLPPVGKEYWEHRNNQLEALVEHVTQNERIILIGDLNTTPWNYFFRRLLGQSGLSDSAQGFGVQPTWPSTNPLLWIPLDHCLHSSDIKIVERFTGPDVGSDHYPLIVDFSPRTPDVLTKD